MLMCFTGIHSGDALRAVLIKMCSVAFDWVSTYAEWAYDDAEQQCVVFGWGSGVYAVVTVADIELQI